MTRPRRFRTRWAWPGVLAALVGFVVMVVGATHAVAHAQLIGTDPPDGAVIDTAPEQLTLTFNEPVQVPDDAVELIDPAGERLGVTAVSEDKIVRVQMPAQVPTGTYVVSWRVTSQDGHPVAGGFTFSVGAPSAPAADVTDGTDQRTENAVRVVQAITYLGQLAAAGLVVFATILAPHRVVVALRTRLRRVLAASCVLAVAGSVLLLPLSAVQQDGGELADVLRAEAWTDQLTGGPGVAAGLVAVGLLTAWLATGAHSGGRGRDAAALGGAAVALGSVVLVGHTRTFGPAWLVVPSDLLHVVTAACWFGGLVALVLTLKARGRALSADDATLALTRFSALAAGLVAVLAVAGILLGWRVLGSWSGLFGTGYGVTLLVKVGIVLVVVAMAAGNRYRLLPRVRAETASAAAWKALRRTVRLEAAVLVAVVATTGVLVSQSPVEDDEASAAADPAPSPMASADLGDGSVTAELSPGTTGPNVLKLELTHATGAPLQPMEEPQVSVTLPEAGVGPLSSTTTNTGPGRFEADVDLPLPGMWEVEVSVRVSEFENPIATIPLEIR